MMTASSMNPTRHESNVVKAPPMRGPIAAAMAPAAPIIAYTFACIFPSKLPWMSDCIAGRYSEAPRPPITAQKTMMAARPCANTIATAPEA